MAKVLCLSSQVVWGPVGNTAAVPALQAEAHEVLQVPTILLSHHPGHGAPARQAIASENFAALLTSIESKGALSDCSAVMTGYFADAEQIAHAANLIARLRQQNTGLLVLVDPVMGDHGALYVPETIAHAIHDQLLPLASIITPNSFELSWLTDHPVTTRHEAETAAQQLAVAETIVTSIPMANQELGTVLLKDGVTHLTQWAKRPHVPHGTGDFLAGCYLAHRLKHPAQTAFAKALQRLHQVIINSGESKILHHT